MRQLIAIACALLVVSMPGIASAASTTFYLASDADPNGSLTPQSPSASSSILATLSPSSIGAAETNASRSRTWSRDLSGHVVSINEVTIWAAPAQVAKKKAVSLRAHIMDCADTCNVLSSKTKSLGSGESLTKLTLPLNVRNHEFGAGHRLVLKITVPEVSEQDVVIAYASSEHPSSVHLSLFEALTTTTTAPPETTTTAPPETTTTTVQTATATPPTTTTTTLPATTTTTTQSGPAVVPPPTTTTTTPGFTGEFQPSSIDIEVLDPFSSEQAGSTKSSSDRAAVAPRIELEPIDGLMVGFSAVVEAFRLYWQVAIALGVLMSGLLVFGFARLELPSAQQDPFDRLRRASTR